MVRLAGSRSEAAAEAADRDRNQRETVRQMGPTPLGRHRHDHRSGFNRQSRGRTCVIQRLANETLDGSFALTMEIRVTLGLQFCQEKGVGSMAPELLVPLNLPSRNTFGGRSVTKITDLTDPKTAGIHNLRPKFDFNAQLFSAPPGEKAWWSAKTVGNWQPRRLHRCVRLSLAESAEMN